MPRKRLWSAFFSASRLSQVPRRRVLQSDRYAAWSRHCGTSDDLHIDRCFLSPLFDLASPIRHRGRSRRCLWPRSSGKNDTFSASERQSMFSAPKSSFGVQRPSLIDSAFTCLPPIRYRARESIEQTAREVVERVIDCLSSPACKFATPRSAIHTFNSIGRLCRQWKRSPWRPRGARGDDCKNLAEVDSRRKRPYQIIREGVYPLNTTIFREPRAFLRWANDW